MSSHDITEIAFCWHKYNVHNTYTVFYMINKPPTRVEILAHTKLGAGHTTFRAGYFSYNFAVHERYFLKLN